MADWIKSSRHTVAFTGAGISVSSGIPDFRGPNGVWTLEKQGKKVEFDVPFDAARPSFTHMALVALMKRGYMHYIVSQNVDGLHIKSGVPRDRLSELHGNIFAEHCDACDTEYIRDFDGQTRCRGGESTSGCAAMRARVRALRLQPQIASNLSRCCSLLPVRGMGCQPTGRLCDNPMCRWPLRDKTIDWDSPLPDAEFARAIDAHKRAELALCLGTSLRIRPAGNMPLRTLRKHAKPEPGRLVIVNLQKTHLDRSASMRLHVRTDALMREVCRLLEVEVDHHDPAAIANEERQQQAADAAAAAPRQTRKKGRATRGRKTAVKIEDEPIAAAAASSSAAAVAVADDDTSCGAVGVVASSRNDAPGSPSLAMRCAAAAADFVASSAAAAAAATVKRARDDRSDDASLDSEPQLKHAKLEHDADKDHDTGVDDVSPAIKTEQ